jgi:hypothetical protein
MSPTADIFIVLKKSQKRTKFDFWFFLVRSPATPDQEKYKTKRSLKNVQSLIFRFSWFARRPPRIKKNTKLKEASKTYKV